jgi:hypothetical protein
MRLEIRTLIRTIPWEPGQVLHAFEHERDMMYMMPDREPELRSWIKRRKARINKLRNELFGPEAA